MRKSWFSILLALCFVHVTAISTRALQAQEWMVAYGEAKYGANGTDEGVAEYAVGNPYDGGFGHTTWDEIVSDGLDSGWVAFDMWVTPNGSLLVIGDCDPVYSLPDSYEGINRVLLIASVSGGDRQCGVRDAYADFYVDGDNLTTPSETVILSRAGNPVASTIGGLPTDTAYRTSSIWPEDSFYEAVHVHFSFRLQSLHSGIPGNPEAGYVQAKVYGN